MIGVGNKMLISKKTPGVAYDLDSLYSPNIIKYHNYGNGGIYFSPDGTDFYSVLTSSRRLYWFTLSTAWDITTLSYMKYIPSYSSSDYFSNVFWKPDGSKIFTGHYSSGYQRIQITDASGWAISGRIPSSSTSKLSLSYAPGGFAFSSNGDNIYILDYNGITLNQYRLRFLWGFWDVSLINWKDLSTELTSNARGLCMSSDGLHLYISDPSAKEIYHYSLSNAFDLYTLSYVGKRDISGLINNQSPFGIFLDPDGNRLFVNTTSEYLYQLNFT